MEGCGAWLVSAGCNCVVDGKLLVELVSASVLELTTIEIEGHENFNHAYKKVAE